MSFIPHTSCWSNPTNKSSSKLEGPTVSVIWTSIKQIIKATVSLLKSAKRT